MSKNFFVKAMVTATTCSTDLALTGNMSMIAFIVKPVGTIKFPLKMIETRIVTVHSCFFRIHNQMNEPGRLPEQSTCWIRPEFSVRLSRQIITSKCHQYYGLWAHHWQLSDKVSCTEFSFFEILKFKAPKNQWSSTE